MASEEESTDPIESFLSFQDAFTNHLPEAFFGPECLFSSAVSHQNAQTRLLPKLKTIGAQLASIVEKDRWEEWHFPQP